MKVNGEHLKKEDVCFWLSNVNMGLCDGKLTINYYGTDASFGKRKLKIELDEKEARSLYKYALKNLLKENNYKGD